MEAIQELSERKTKILHAIIKNYLETGEPVGSRTISKYTDLKFKFGNDPEMRWQISKSLVTSCSLTHQQEGFRRIKVTDGMWIC